MALSDAFTSLPPNLSKALLREYSSITDNFRAHRWGAAELSGGKFCEIVFTVLNGYPTKTYPLSPQKPKDFVSACRKLESNTGVPRSFQILIPRILPALYEIRNNRGVGHAGRNAISNSIKRIIQLQYCLLD